MEALRIKNIYIYLSLFSDNMIIWIGNPKESIVKLLKLIHKFGVVAEYKVKT